MRTQTDEAAVHFRTYATGQRTSVLPARPEVGFGKAFSKVFTDRQGVPHRPLLGYQ